MKFLTGVTICEASDAGYILMSDKKKKTVLKEHEYILHALRDQYLTKEQMLLHIMETEDLDETAAGFVLAEFIIEYADFLEKDHTHYEIMDEWSD